MFQSINILLGDSAKRHNIQKEVTSFQIIESFSEILSIVCGEKVSQNAKVLHIKEKTITIACLSAIIAQEITLNREILIEKTNQKFATYRKTGILEKIRFIF